MRITGLKNTFNTFESALDVDVYRTDIRAFVVITEPSDNPGPSITNAAETFCPQIAESLGLGWRRCVFIESYPRDRHRVGTQPYDPTYDLIRLAGPPRAQRVMARNLTLPWADLDRPGWRPLSLELAEALQRAGCRMSDLIGCMGEFSSFEGDRRGRYRIDGYDGRRYHTAGGPFTQQELRRVLTRGVTTADNRCALDGL